MYISWKLEKKEWKKSSPEFEPGMSWLKFGMLYRLCHSWKIGNTNSSNKTLKITDSDLIFQSAQQNNLKPIIETAVNAAQINTLNWFLTQLYVVVYNIGK